MVAVRAPSAQVEPRGPRKNARARAQRLLITAIGRYGIGPVIVGVTIFCAAISAAAAGMVADFVGHSILPHIYHGILIPAIAVPPMAALVVKLVQRLDRAERRISAALLSSESGFETLTRISPVGIFQTDANGSALFANHRCHEILGIDETRMLGAGWVQALHPDDRDRVLTEWQASVAVGLPFKAEYRFQRPDGSVVWVLGQAEAQHSDGGEIIGYFGTLTDITKNKENEKTLQRTNRALAVVSQCNEALVRITDESDLLSAICRIVVETGRYRMAWVGFAENDEDKSVRPAAMWGYDYGYLASIRLSWSESKRSGQGPAGIAIRSGRPYVVRDVVSDPIFVGFRNAALSRGYHSLIIMPLTNRSQVFGLMAIYSPDTHAFDDEEVGLLTTLADNLAYGITAIRTRAERAGAEEATRESEGRFRATFEQAAVGMSHVSLEGRYLRVNQKLCDITGYSRDELLQKTYRDLTHPDDVAYDDGHVRRLLRGELKALSLEKRYIRKDGSIIWVNRTISLVRDEAGNSKYMIAVSQDITESKQIESQLRQAQKMEAVGQLTGGVAHDFNNLLTVVIGNLELLKERLTTEPKLRELAERATDAANRGAALTQRLLAFSRKQVLQPEFTDINHLVEGLHELIRRSLGESFHIEARLARDVGGTMVDPIQLESALLNLAVNARDAMPRGGTLIIETRRVRISVPGTAADGEVAPGEYLLLSVTDTGIGMPPEVRERVFEPFFTTKEVGKGSGLGLSMVYGFVKQTGGHVTITSELGKGTAVQIYLPCIGGNEMPRTDDHLHYVGGQPHGETILVIEDDLDVRELTVTMLRELGYKVLESTSAEDALALLESATPVDLVLTDVVLSSNLTGSDLVREAARRRPGIKVVFMSGYSEQIKEGSAPSNANIRVLQKPFRKTDLADEVQLALTG